MSIAVQTRVWQESQHKGSALLLLLAIADCCNDEGKNAFPSVRTLAKKTRQTERNVQLLITKLQESGELSVEVGKAQHGTNCYTIHLDKLGQKGGENFSPPKSFRGEKSRAKGVKSFRGAERGGVKQISPDPSTDPSCVDPSTTDAADAAVVVAADTPAATTTADVGETSQPSSSTPPNPDQSMTYVLLRRRKVHAAREFAGEDFALVSAYLHRVGPDYHPAQIVEDLRAGLHRQPAEPAPATPPAAAEDEHRPAWLSPALWTPLFAGMKELLQGATYDGAAINGATPLATRLLTQRFPQQVADLLAALQGGTR